MLMLRGLIRTLPLLIVCLLVSFVSLAEAGRIEVKELAYEAMDVYSKDGFKIRDELQVGKLMQGESYYFDTQLSVGNEYFFYTAGDDSVFAMEIWVYDENWQLVAANNERGPQAEVLYEPEWSGIFHVKVTMYEAAPDGGYWFIISGYK